MAGRVVRGALAAVALLSFAACGGGGSSTVVATTTSVPAATLTGFAECAFAPNGPVTTAGLATSGPALAVSWDTPESTAGSKSSSLVDTVGPYRIGFERDGNRLSRFLFDSTTGKRTELTGAYTETEQGISMVLLLNQIPRINHRVPWHATVEIDGSQVARCPAKGSSKFGDPKPK